jgi:hypothetical protein
MPSWQWPTESRSITQAFRDPANPAHSGLDIGAATGQPIVAPTSGTIERIWPNEPSGYGNLVILDTDDGHRVLLGHMSRFGDIQETQRVMPGQVLGYIGATGNATGPHLHLEVRDQNNLAIDPAPLLGKADPLDISLPPPMDTPTPTVGTVVDSPTPDMDNIAGDLAAGLGLFGSLLQPQPGDTTTVDDQGNPATVITLFSTPLGPVKFNATKSLVNLAFITAGTLLILFGLAAMVMAEFKRMQDMALGAAPAVATAATGNPAAGAAVGAVTSAKTDRERGAALGRAYASETARRKKAAKKAAKTESSDSAAFEEE